LAVDSPQEVGVERRLHRARAQRSSCASGRAGESPTEVGRAGIGRANRSWRSGALRPSGSLVRSGASGPSG
jgi:hypothetical protein